MDCLVIKCNSKIFVADAPQHSRQGSRDSQRSRISRQNSREGSVHHSRQGSRDASSGDGKVNSDFNIAETLVQTAEKLQGSTSNHISSVSTPESTGSSVQNNIEIYATLPKKKGKKIANEKLSIAAPLKSPVENPDKKTGKDKKTTDKKDKPKDKKPKQKVDDSDYSSDHSNRKSPSRKNQELKQSDDVNAITEVKDDKPVGKKQHKIRRKLLMGGLIRRKNRSMPDLREGQEDEKQNFEEIEVRSLSRPITPSPADKSSMAGYLSEGHLENSSNPNLERSKLMRKSFHGSVGKGLPPPAACTKVPPPIPQRTSSQLSQNGEKKSSKDKKSDRRPPAPMPQNGEEESPPALPPRSYTPELSSNVNNININNEPQPMGYTNPTTHQYDNISSKTHQYSANNSSSNLPRTNEKHVYSQPSMEPMLNQSKSNSPNHFTVQADVHAESGVKSNSHNTEHLNNCSYPNSSYHNQAINSYQCNQFQSSDHHSYAHEGHFNGQHMQVRDHHRNNSQMQSNSQNFSHEEFSQHHVNHSHHQSSSSTPHSQANSVSSVPLSSQNSAIHSRQGSEDFPPPPPPLEEALEDLKSRGLLPPSNSLLATNNLKHHLHHPTNHTNDHSSSNDSKTVGNNIQETKADHSSSLLSQLQQKKQQLLSQQLSSSNTNSMERNSGKRLNASGSGSWLQELQAKQAALKQRQEPSSNSDSQPSVDEVDSCPSVKEVVSQFGSAKISEGVDEVDCAIRLPGKSSSSTDSVDRRINPELFNREYTQCNSLTFPSQSGQESRLMNSNGNRVRSETSENGILKQTSTPMLGRHNTSDSRGSNTSEGIKRKPKKTVTFCDQVVLVATAEDEEEDAYIPNPILERVLKSAMTAPGSNSDGSDSPALPRSNISNAAVAKIASPEPSPQSQNNTQDNKDQQNNNAGPYSPQRQTQSSNASEHQHSAPHNTLANSMRPQPTAVKSTVPHSGNNATTAPQYRLPPPYVAPPSVSQAGNMRNANNSTPRIVPNGAPPPQSQHQQRPILNSNSPYQSPPAPNTLKMSPSTAPINDSTTAANPASSLPNSNQGNMARYQPPPHPNYPRPSRPLQGQLSPQQGMVQSHQQPQQQQFSQRGPVMTRQNSNLGEQQQQQRYQPMHPVQGHQPMHPAQGHQQMPPYQKVPYQQQPQHNPGPAVQEPPPNGPRYGQRPPQPHGYGSVGRGGVAVHQQQYNGNVQANGHMPPYQHPPKPHTQSTNSPSASTSPGHFAGPLDPNAIYSTVNKSAKKNTSSSVNNTSISSTNSNCSTTANNVNNNVPVQPCNLCHKKPVTAPSIYCFDCNYYMSRFKPKS